MTGFILDGASVLVLVLLVLAVVLVLMGVRSVSGSPPRGARSIREVRTLERPTRTPGDSLFIGG